MSTFRKMRIVNEPINNVNDINTAMKYQTSVNVSRLSDLDRDIEDILNQNIDDNSKLKLYSQALRRFLSYKKLKQEEDILHQNKYLEGIKDIFIEERKKEAKRKKPIKKVVTKVKVNKEKKKVSSPKKAKKKSIKSEDDLSIEYDFSNILPVKKKTKASNIVKKSKASSSATADWEPYDDQ